jgi:integrase
MIYKRGKRYWYRFMWDGKLVRESTKQGNDKVARQMEAAHRTSLAKGEVGIRERKKAPSFCEFAEKQFLPWAETTFSAKRKTWLYYRNGVRRLKGYSQLCSLPLDDAKLGEKVSGYIAHRQAKGLQVASVNRELQVLRRLLHLAVEWGFVDQVPKIRMLSGEQHREFVLSQEEEAKYLAASSEPLASVATVLSDTGMRPEECYRLRWEYIIWVNGRHGSLLVTHGKTAAARRSLPMTPRVRALLETRWKTQEKPTEGYVWPAPSKSGHIEPSSLKKQHAKALKVSKVRRFVLYSLRHTFLTRLGASGCNVWTLARIAGHCSIAISARYVHPSEDAVLTAMSRLPGHNSGHSEETQQELRSSEGLQATQNEGENGAP